MQTVVTEVVESSQDTLEYEPASPRQWRAGTLTYSAAGLIVLFCWLLFGDFAVSLRDRSVQPIVQLMLQKFAVSNTVMGIAISFLPPAVAILVAPVVSSRSDRFRSRFGRRVPFLLVTTPLGMLSMIGVALTPRIAGYIDSSFAGHSPGFKFWLLLCFGLFWTAFEVSIVVNNCLLPALINDVVPRPVLGRFYGLFRVVSLLDGIFFNAFVIGHAEQHYESILILIAFVFGGGFLLTCLRVKEGDYPPVDESAVQSNRRGSGSIRQFLRECFGTPYYLLAFSAITCGLITFMPINTYCVLYAKSLNISMDVYGKWIAASFVISLLLAYPIGWMADLIQPLRMAILSMTLYCVTVSLGTFSIHDTRSFGIAFGGHVVLSGMYFTSAASLLQILLPREKFGQFASASMALTAFATMGMGLLIGPILDYSNSNYRITFAVSALLALAAVILLTQVHLRRQHQQRYALPR